MLYVIGIWKFVKNEIIIELLCQQTHLALIMSWTCLMSMKIWTNMCNTIWENAMSHSTASVGIKKFPSLYTWKQIFITNRFNTRYLIGE